MAFYSALVYVVFIELSGVTSSLQSNKQNKFCLVKCSFSKRGKCFVNVSCERNYARFTSLFDSDKSKKLHKYPNKIYPPALARSEGGRLLVSRRGDCSVCKGMIPLWKLEEGGDAAVGSAGDAELTAVPAWELRRTRHDKFSGLGVGGRHGEEAARG